MVGDGVSPSERYFPSSTTPAIWIHFPVVAWRNRLPDGIFARQELADERLIDQSNRRRVFRIAPIQVAAGHQACPHGLQIAGSDVVHIRQRDVARARLRFAFEKDAAIGNIQGQRQAIDDPGGLNSRAWSGPYRADGAETAGRAPRRNLARRNRRTQRRHVADRIQDSG